MTNSNQNENIKEHTENAEDPFSLIEKGNSLESSQNKWGSSEYYSRASSSLLREYHSIINNPIFADNNDNDKDASKMIEKMKIAALYHDQSVQYLNKARRCLIGALMFEREEDLRRWGESEPMVERTSSDGSVNDMQKFSPLMNLLTNEESKKRMETFHRLFVSPIVNNVVIKEIESLQGLKDDGTIDCPNHTNILNNEDIESRNLEDRLNGLDPIQNNLNDKVQKKHDDNNMIEENLTLEQRLARLNSTLPDSSAKKKSNDDHERFEKIKNGLNGLGIFYVPTENKQSLIDEPITDDEQMEMIMNMAKDEALLDKISAGEQDNDETVEDIMKRSGIRFELPGEDNDDDLDNNFLDPNDAEVAFWSTLVIDNEDDNNKKHEECHQIGIELDDDDDDFYNFKNVDDFKRGIAKSQQMLLQANVCLDEIDFTIEDKISTPTAKEMTVNEGVSTSATTDDESCENILDKKGSVETVNESEHDPSESIEEHCKIWQDQRERDSVDENEQESNCDKKEDALHEEVAVEGDHDEDCTEAKHSASKLPKNDESAPEEGKESEIDTEDKHEENVLADGKFTNMLLNKEIKKKKRVIKIGCNHEEYSESSANEMKRMNSLGKESIIKAHAILESIIKAWPEDLK